MMSGVNLKTRLFWQYKIQRTENVTMFLGTLSVFFIIIILLSLPRISNTVPFRYKIINALINNRK